MSDVPRRFGDYLLLKSLGAGGGGDVHLARRVDRSDGGPKMVVIKRLHASLAGEEEFVLRFEHEAKLATLIDNPHVAKMFESGAVGDELYIALEHIIGWPLNHLIAKLRGDRARPPCSAAIDLMLGALDGLSALHRAESIHRDIAPKNIMMRADGSACLIDLGIGKSRMSEWKTETGVVLGSPGYMAPEYLRGRPIDRRADLFAIGVVLWELIALEPFIRGSTPHQRLLAGAAAKYQSLRSVREDVPEVLDRLLERALAREPEERFPDAGSFAEALRAVVPREAGAEWFVERMPREELEQEETEVRAFEAMPMPSLTPAAPVTVPPVTIYASRLRSLPPRLPPSRKLERALVAAIVLALVFVVGLASQVFVDEPRPVEAPSRPEVTAEPLQTPRIVVRQRESEEPPASRADTAPATKRLAKPIKTKAAPAVPEEPEPREPAGPMERVSAMLDRVRLVQRADPANAEAASLFHDLIRLKASPSIDAELEEIARLEARVAALAK